MASAGDRAAADFVSRSHAAGAALLYPRDLSRPGWLFSPNDPADATVCVAGERVRLSDIPGILPRLAAVTEADLPHIVAEDRAFIASEMTAFLLALLASAGARTINRPTPQCLCGPAWTDAKWRRTAAALGLPVSSRHPQARLGALRSGEVEPSPVLVGVVGGRCPAEPDPDRAATAIALARVAEADLLTVAFDGPGPDARILRAYPWVDLDDPETERAVLMLFGVQSAMGGARAMQDLVLHDSALGT